MLLDFSAWFEVYLDDRWWTFDARNNTPRFARILMATGRDASDVALTTSFGRADLVHFFVVSEEEVEPLQSVQTVTTVDAGQDSTASSSTATLSV